LRKGSRLPCHPAEAAQNHQAKERSHYRHLSPRGVVKGRIL
jgi:hypothetical protein